MDTWVEVWSWKSLLCVIPGDSEDWRHSRGLEDQLRMESREFLQVSNNVYIGRP